MIDQRECGGKLADLTAPAVVGDTHLRCGDGGGGTLQLSIRQQRNQDKGC